MDDLLRLFVPRALVAETLAALAREPAPARSLTMADAAPAVLDMAGVRCALVRFAGTNLHMRSPYLHPLSMDLDGCEYRMGLSALPGVDWIVCGGEMNELAYLLSRRAALSPALAVSLHPFDAVSGTLSREPRPGEPVVTAPRTTENYNQDFWEQNKKNLLHSDVSGWGAFGANTSDCLGLLLPSVGKCLRRVPRLIVDIGCGLGITTHSLAAAFPDSRVVGLELSPDAIDVARATFTRGNLTFAPHDISDPLPFEEGEVDLAVAVNAMAYAGNQLLAARGVFRTLSPEGTFVHVSRTLDSHLFWDFPLSMAHPTVFQINASDYIQAAAAFGFATSVKPVPGLWGMDSEFFQPRRLSRFKDLFGLCNKFLKNVPAYLPAMSHAVFSHCRQPAPYPAYLDETCYFARLEAVLATMLRLPARAQEAALVGWNCTRVVMNLHRDFGALLPSLLPGVSAMLDVVMTDSE